MSSEGEVRVPPNPTPYRGRLAPSPTGFLHLGHARTFWVAQERARLHHGTLILRNEDLDRPRCRPEFVAAMFEDLRWFGCEWQEGPDLGGPCAPYSQSERRAWYLDAFEQLRAAGAIYSCACSRQDVLRALGAPHTGEDEPLYPGTCRPHLATSSIPSIPDSIQTLPFPSPQPSPQGRGRTVVRASTICDAQTDRTADLGTSLSPGERAGVGENSAQPASSASRSPSVNWRFRVPDGEIIVFDDVRYGRQEFIAGKDFGDFIVWRHDDLPAYQLAVVVDDAAMGITEVVRGEDLLRSTARQLLLYRALGLTPPQFYHCPLVTDAAGVRLAKRHDSLSLRALRGSGAQPETLRCHEPSSPPLS
jgi:glutamyl/glutaminyl-tRNA synthetase